MKQLVIILIFFFSLTAFTQRGRNNPRIKAFKIAFITENLDLSEKESEKFWPLYNKHEKEKHRLFEKERTQIRKKIMSSGGPESISEKEAEEYLNQLLQIRTLIHQEKAKFFNDLKAILPAKKIIQLEIAEHKFNRRLVEKLKNRRQKRMNR